MKASVIFIWKQKFYLAKKLSVMGEKRTKRISNFHSQDKFCTADPQSLYDSTLNWKHTYRRADKPPLQFTPAGKIWNTECFHDASPSVSLLSSLESSQVRHLLVQIRNCKFVELDWLFILGTKTDERREVSLSRPCCLVVQFSRDFFILF